MTSKTKPNEQRPKAIQSPPRRSRESLRRGSRPRRRYLYEIEFFDAGHAPVVGAPAIHGPVHEVGRAAKAQPTVYPVAAEFCFEDPELDEGPRDPRIQRMIRAAASTWVTSKATQSVEHE